MRTGLAVRVRLILLTLVFCSFSDAEANSQMLQAMLGVANVCTPLTQANAPQSMLIESIWHLDEATGATTLADATTNNRTVTSTSTFKQANPGKVRTAIRGAADGFGMSTTNQLPNPQTFSVTAWVRASGSGSGVITGFANARTGTPGSYDRYFGMNSSGQLVFAVYSGNGVGTMTTPLSYNDGNWHHVAVSYAAPVGKIYVDGVNVHTITNLGNAQNYNGYLRIAGAYTIGWENLNFPASTWLGNLDEVVVYSVALTDPEVAAIASSPTELNSSSPHWADAVGVYHFNETSGVYLDSGTTANHTTGTSAKPTPGFYSNGYTGGGSIQLVSTASTASPDNMTMAFWFRTTTASGGVMAQFTHTQSLNPGTYDRQIVMNSNGTVAFGTYNSTFWVLTSSASYNDGNWHHIAVTYQAAVRQDLYVDGVQLGTTTPGTAQSFTGYWHYGNGNISGWGAHMSMGTTAYSGDLDEVGFWRTVLSGPEVLALYNRQKQCP